MAFDLQAANEKPGFKEPDKKQLLSLWKIAIGLLAVEGLTASDYLIGIAVKNMEGEVTINQAQVLISNYYTLHPAQDPEDRSETADLLSARVVKVLSARSVPSSLTEYLSLHKDLFSGIFASAGTLRTDDLTRAEWVTGGKEIFYRRNPKLAEIADAIFTKEKNLKLHKLSEEKVVRHLALLISGIWQLHLFASGNTLAAAIFLIRYLEQLGYPVTEDVFARHAWYFRNAIVRASFADEAAGVGKTTEYLELFLRNLILGEDHPLENEKLFIGNLLQQTVQSETEQLTQDLQDIRDGLKAVRGVWEEQKQDIDAKPDFDKQKQYIELEKQDIKLQKQDMQNEKQNFQTPDGEDKEPQTRQGRISVQIFTTKTRRHIEAVQTAFPEGQIFGRTEVMQVLQITPSPASTFLQKLLAAGIIEPVRGHGKGKYRVCGTRQSQSEMIV